MKKLSFFLMAMLFSVMSFAQEAIYTLDGTITGGSNGYADASSLTQGNIAWSVTGNTTMSPWRIGGKSITNQDRAVYSKNPLAYNIDKIELTHGTANSITVNSLKLIISDVANGAGETIDVTFKASATTTIDLPEGDYSNKYFKFLYNVTVSDSKKNKFVEFKSAKFYAALAEDAVKAPVITGAEDFVSETEVTIEAEDDVTVYYTLDGTEPTNASTVYAAPFTVKETTTVKAVAYRGEKASFVTSATFTQATRVTAAEAAELAMKVASNNALTSVTYVIDAYVTSVIDQTLSSGQQRFWVADTEDGGQVLQSYYCNVPQVLKVGDYIQMFGKLTKYNTSPQMKNGDVTILEEPTPEPVKYTVIVTANAEGENVVSGGGEYEEGKEVTVTASEDLEGWVFIGWTEDGEFVANDPEYTFVVKGDVELVAVYAMDLGENKVTDLVIDGDNMLLTGSVADFQMGTMNLELALGEYDEEEGTYLLTEESKLYVGETNFTFVDGMATVDMNTNSAMAIVVFEYNGTYYYMTVNMSKKIEATIIEIADATVTIEERSMGFGDEVYHVLKMESTWSDGETTYPVLLETTEFDQTKESQEVAASIRVGGMGDEDPWLGNAEGDVTITVADGKVTVEGLLENAYALPAPIAFDVTISGKLPVVEPTTITYELNGGEFPAVVVPTNEELAMAFKQEYAEYFAIEGLTDTDMNREVGNFIYVTNSKGGDAVKFITENANWKWLHDYILTVAGNIPEGTNVGYYWRANIDGFFHCKNAVLVGGVASADFTEAGKPEAWGAAYEAEYGVVLPTEPVAEDYVLPTPVKEGYTFVGWYDNAEGTGEAYKVIPAGWAGTLYAIWKQGTTTALENIAVEGKAVKAIVNGQLIIIKNGVQYNAQGAVVK